MLLLTNGDTESDSVPKEKISNKILSPKQNLLINSLRSKVIFCISKTNLDSSVDDKTIEILTYNLFGADELNNQKRGGVCLYFKKLYIL